MGQIFLSVFLVKIIVRLVLPWLNLYSVKAYSALHKLQLRITLFSAAISNIRSA